MTSKIMLLVNVFQGFVVTFVADDLHQYICSELHAMIYNEWLVHIVSMLVETCIETYVII